MSSEHLLLKTVPCDKYDLMSKGDLVTLYKGAEKVIGHLRKELDRLTNELTSFEQKSFFVEEEVMELRRSLFGESSEKKKSLSGSDGKGNKGGNEGKKKVQLPSERYPNVPVEEVYIEESEPPLCGCCGGTMHDSGMTEDSEELTVIPRKFKITRFKKVKYRCSGCHGGLKTAQGNPRILPGSSYSDEMILDVAMSKYLDLIPWNVMLRWPVERECQGYPHRV